VSFENPEIEYTTRQMPYSTEACSASFDSEMNAEGWRRVWADVTLEGVFAVYRRPRPQSPLNALLALIRAIETVFEGDLSWETKFDQIFDCYSERLRPLLNEMGLRLEYYDPDTTYEEDVTALVTALRELRGRVP
jgi:hypothetical protein